jgi:uncharacterized membrane protein YeaQ/YmgE (transglycosylase-associated protein family)
VNLLELLIALVVAGICGAIGEWVVGFRAGGALISIIIGVIGAYVGNLFAGLVFRSAPSVQHIVFISVGRIQYDLVWALIGSILIVFGLAALRGSRNARYTRRA